MISNAIFSIVLIFTFIVILLTMFFPFPEYVECPITEKYPYPEKFTSAICSKKHKIDSIPNNILFEKQDETQYTTELKNKQLKQIFKKYYKPKTLEQSWMTLDVNRLSSKEFSFYLKNMITQWFFEKKDLKYFKCVLVVPKVVHKYDKYDNIEPNENVSFSTEALIHRQSKNVGKHLLINGEILQNKLHINFIRILGSIYHDNLYFDKFSSFSSSPASYLSVYDFYQY